LRFQLAGRAYSRKTEMPGSVLLGGKMAAAFEWWMSACRQLHEMSAEENVGVSTIEQMLAERSVGEPTITLLARSSFQM
jgi:hypothetical protein